MRVAPRAPHRSHRSAAVSGAAMLAGIRVGVMSIPSRWARWARPALWRRWVNHDNAWLQVGYVHGAIVVVRHQRTLPERRRAAARKLLAAAPTSVAARCLSSVG